MPRVVTCLLAAFLIATATARTAFAGHDPNPSQIPAAVAQYVEMFPTSAGPSTGSGTKNPIPAHVKTEIAAKGGSDAQTLERLIRSSAAPATASKSASSKSARPKNPATRKATHEPTSQGQTKQRPLVIPTARHRGSLAALVNTAPGKTVGFWLLIAAATLVALILRRSSRGDAPPSTSLHSS